MGTIGIVRKGRRRVCVGRGSYTRGHTRGRVGHTRAHEGTCAIIDFDAEVLAVGETG